MNRLINFARSDGMGLALLAISCILRGISYLPIEMWLYKGSGHPAEKWLPLDTWAVVWIAVGFLSIGVAIHWRDTRIAALAWGACIGLHMLWGVSFVSQDLIGDSARGWVSALGYFSTAAIALWALWRGSSHQVCIKRGGRA